MQIQLVQNEIEQALRRYVADLINIKEGTQINIDLSAGRGADGFKATIDLVLATAGASVAPQQPQTKPADKEKAKSEPAEEKQTSKAAETKAAQTQASAESKPEAQTQTGAATGSATVAGEETATETAQTATADATADVAQTEAAATEAQSGEGEQAAQPRKSLFGGLTKPVNE